MTAFSAIWPLGLYFAGVVLLAAALIVISYVLGERHSGKSTAVPYESGIEPTGTARVRFDVKYFRVAIFFVIFDVEAVFILAWAISVQESGWPGFLEMIVFVGILIAALAYLWRLGGLESGVPAQKAPPAQPPSASRSR